MPGLENRAKKGFYWLWPGKSVFEAKMSARDGRAEKVRKHFLPFKHSAEISGKFTMISWETLGAVPQISVNPGTDLFFIGMIWAAEARADRDQEQME